MRLRDQVSTLFNSRMMKTMKTFSAIALVLFSINVYAIQQFDIRMVLDGIDCDTRQACYMVQLRSSDGQAWNLGGQNYRLFYDASMGSYIAGSAESQLNVSQYSNVLVTNANPGVDASSFGNGILPFDMTLGFLNYQIDLMNLSNGGVDLPANGDWVTTTMLCFTIAQTVLDDPSQCFSVVWARMGLTDSYATAFVEVSQWVSTNSTTDAIANDYDDLGPDDGDASCLTALCDGTMVENENTDETCSDGIDNDLDGLIDCADDSCAGTMVCKDPPNRFDLAFNRASIDCMSGMVCYDINIRSTGDSYTLGNQQYRLFYNSQVAEFVSGVSQLSNSEFGPLTLEGGTPIENTNANGLGSLSYEDDLGFVNFSILLQNPASGSTVTIGSGAFMTTAQLCFTMSDETISNSNVCFEATWARNGVTDGYNSSMVEIQEWSDGSNLTLLADSYEDLTPSSGDEACFNMACGGSESGNDECSDGIDNDNDGMIDCLDTDCSQLDICGNCTAIAPTLGRN